MGFEGVSRRSDEKSTGRWASGLWLLDGHWDGANGAMAFLELDIYMIPWYIY
jgi:hypothetical protein